MTQSSGPAGASDLSPLTSSPGAVQEQRTTSSTDSHDITGSASSDDSDSIADTGIVRVWGGDLRSPPPEYGLHGLHRLAGLSEGAC